jgi:HAMP domain-containing protein
VSIEWFRDLVLCIFGLGVTAVAIFLAVLAFSLYRRLSPALDSLKATTKTVENLSSCVEVEVARPLAQLAAFVQGIRQAVSLVSRFTKRKEEGRNE